MQPSQPSTVIKAIQQRRTRQQRRKNKCQVSSNPSLRLREAWLSTDWAVECMSNSNNCQFNCSAKARSAESLFSSWPTWFLPQTKHSHHCCWPLSHLCATTIISGSTQTNSSNAGGDRVQEPARVQNCHPALLWQQKQQQQQQQQWQRQQQRHTVVLDRCGSGRDTSKKQTDKEQWVPHWPLLCLMTQHMLWH
jgi:hypothetical protein